MTNQRETEPLWRQGEPIFQHAAALPTEPVDTVVVGAGITGITAAYLLRQAGQRVVVIDMHGVGAGDTGRTTAHLTQLLDDGFAALCGRFGDDGGRLVAESQMAAIAQMEQLIYRERIACDWARVPAFFYSDKEKTDSRVTDDLKALQRIGVAAVETRDVPLPFPVRVALRVENQAQVQAMAYVRGLTQAFLQAGGLLRTQTRVLSVDHGEPCTVHTDEGDVHAKDVIMATHSPVTRFNFHTKIYAYRTYVFAAKVQRLPPPGLYLDAQEPYHYTRPHPAATGDVLIVGGADHKTGQEEDTEAHFASLESYMRSHFAVEHLPSRWSGQVLETADGLPFIGPNGSDDHVWVASGYAGNGITSGTLAAMIVSDSILAQENRYAALYSSRRLKPLAQLRRMVRENVDVPVHLIGDRLKPDAASPQSLGKGCGALVHHNDQVMAMYRDEQGTLHAMSPVCSHLGCFVKWNGAESSWDCPCHGSRFNAVGQLLQGPAVEDLAHMEAIAEDNEEPADPPLQDAFFSQEPVG